MTTTSERLTESVRARPVYLPVGLLLTGLIGAYTATVAAHGGTGLHRVLLGALAVFFLPGFALVMLLFPAANRPRDGGPNLPFRNDGATLAVGSPVTNAERLVLSVGFSLCMIPLVGLVVDFGPWPVTTETILFALGATTVALAGVASARWLSLPPERRFGLHLLAGARRAREQLFSGTATEVTLNVALVVGFLLVASGLTVAVVAPNDGEQFTGFSLTAPDPVSGELGAEHYPESVALGEGVELGVSVENREDRTVEYTVLVLIQQLDPAGSGEVVRREATLDRFTTTLASGETWTRRHTVQPTFAGEELRLTYLLYTGEPPADPGTGTADEQVHLWLSVTDGSGTEEGSQ